MLGKLLWAALALLPVTGFTQTADPKSQGEGAWGGRPPAPERYLGLDYYDGAMKRLGR